MISTIKNRKESEMVEIIGTILVILYAILMIGLVCLMPLILVGMAILGIFLKRRW